LGSVNWLNSVKDVRLSFDIDREKGVWLSRTPISSRVFPFIHVWRVKIIRICYLWLM
jgi:hypothetical protein